MYESRVKNTCGIEGEIGEKMSDLHKEHIMDLWHVLFGNGETDEFDISKLIYGLNSYQRLKSSSEIQKAFGIEACHLSVNAVPPGMKKLIVTGQLGGKVVKSKAAASTGGNNGRKPGRPPITVVLSSASSLSAAVTVPTATHNLDNSKTDSIVCLNCSDSYDTKNDLVCDQCNRRCHFGCAVPSLSRVPEGNWSCQECTGSIISSNINGKKIRENEECDQRIYDRISINTKKDCYVCNLCRKQFNSLVEYQYHVKFVCLKEGSAVNKKHVNKSTTLRKTEHDDSRKLDSNVGSKKSKYTNSENCDERSDNISDVICYPNNSNSSSSSSSKEVNIDDRGKKMKHCHSDLDHPRLSETHYRDTKFHLESDRNMNKYMSENARKSFLYHNYRKNWLSNPITSFALCSIGRNFMLG